MGRKEAGQFAPYSFQFHFLSSRGRTVAMGGGGWVAPNIRIGCHMHPATRPAPLTVSTEQQFLTLRRKTCLVSRSNCEK